MASSCEVCVTALLGRRDKVLEAGASSGAPPRKKRAACVVWLVPPLFCSSAASCSPGGWGTGGTQARRRAPPMLSGAAALTARRALRRRPRARLAAPSRVYCADAADGASQRHAGRCPRLPPGAQRWPRRKPHARAGLYTQPHTPSAFTLLLDTRLRHQGPTAPAVTPSHGPCSRSCELSGAKGTREHQAGRPPQRTRW